MVSTADGDHSVGVPAHDDAINAVHEVFDRLVSGKEGRSFAIRLWNDDVIPATDTAGARFTLVLKHPGALRRMFLPPGELTLGEAYLRGDFDVEGDMVAAMQLMVAVVDLKARDWLFMARKVLSLPGTEPPQVHADGRQRVQLSGARHTRERDRSAVEFHYNVGNAFYELFLGQWMAYSAAYFSDAEMSLDAAQEAKLNYICRKLRLKPGDRLLDIGCGWGGLLVYAAQHYGVHATGINLSQPQIAYAREWAERAGVADRVQVENRDYRDLDPAVQYDKIVSVGMAEHVGESMLRTYMDAVFRVLRPGGLFLNHAITAQFAHMPGWIERTFFQAGRFSQKYVFPDGEILTISLTLTAAEEVGFEVFDVEGLREHYALTLRNWVRNLESHHTEAVQLTDERTYRVWRLYMSVSAVGFEIGEFNVTQSLLSKSRGRQPEKPLTRVDLYA